MSTTASALARTFGIIIRQIADLLTILQDYATLAPTLPRTLDISYQESVSLQLMIENLMKPNWDWLMTVLDSTEAQLRFGSALAGATDPNHPSLKQITRTSSGPSQSSSHHGGHHLERLSSRHAISGLSGAAVADPQANRRDFLQYALSLMRAHHSEHSDSLPVLDVSAMKHIAYVFDALIYYMRSGNDAIEDSKANLAMSSVVALRRAPSASVQPPAPATPAPAPAPNPPDFNMDFAEDESSRDQEQGGQEDASNQPQPMDLDCDDENTNQSVSSQAVAPPPAAAAAAVATPSAATVGEKKSERKHQSRGRKHNFFQRSESTLCLGCPPPDPFQYPLHEALPLADQPQLLQPNARREDLFGTPKQPVTVLPTNLGLATKSEIAGSAAPQANLSATANIALSTAPFQAGPSAEANFDRIVHQQQR